MDLSLWLLFILTFVSALAIPGPNAAYVIAQTLRHGPEQGLFAAAGFAFASGLNLVIVMTGLGLILSQSMNLLIYLKWVGVAYLLFMAYKAFKADPAALKPDVEIKTYKSFGIAVMISLSNPKIVLINMMLLPLFLVPQKSIVIQGAVITLTGIVLSFLVYAVYALVASRLVAKLKTRTANRIVGSAYTCAAGALATINN